MLSKETEQWLQDLDGILDVKDVARILKCSVRTVYRMIYSHELDSYLAEGERNIRTSELKRYLSRHSNQ